MAKLAEFYQTYDTGLPSELIAAREASPQDALYRWFVDRVSALVAPRPMERWIDVAAGTGIFTQQMAARFPASDGVAIDYHQRPAYVTEPNVTWHQGDLSEGALRTIAPANAVVALAVLEHVRAPLEFFEQLLHLTKPGGLVYVMCPSASSFLGRVLGTKWPYYSPGEHLNVPTLEGARRLVQRALAAAGRRATHLDVRPVNMRYTIQYLASYARLPLRKAIPPTWAIPVPSGVLEIAAIVS